MTRAVSRSLKTFSASSTSPFFPSTKRRGRSKLIARAPCRRLIELMGIVVEVIVASSWSSATCAGAADVVAHAASRESASGATSFRIAATEISTKISRAMRRSEKAERIMQFLDGLYPEPDIPLDHRDPYTLLVAVVLSAQTTDKKVNQVTPYLFEEAPTVYALAKMPVGRIRHIIRQLGLAPQKAKAL